MREEFEAFEDEIEQGRQKWKPTRGIVINLEVEKRLLNSLGDIAEVDGVNSVYQMIRNALYSYVRYRMSKTGIRRKERRCRYDADTDES